MPKSKLRRQQPVINYRNAIYQGGFNFNQQQRHGFGILYLSSSHQFIASHWQQDKLNGHSIIFIDSQKYIYGSYYKGEPHGIVYSRFGQTLTICSYQYGSINEKIILISEEYNIASVVSLSIDQKGNINSEILSKGQLYSKERLQQLANECGWGQFSQCYETLVKYISQNMTNKKVMLELVNNCFYRFGFVKYGLAIMFDDYYNIKSVGVHANSQLKGLGLRYLTNKIIQQGNWSTKGQVFAFSATQIKPVKKLNKVYRNFHLKEINYVNVFVKNSSEQTYKEIESILTGELTRQLIAGMIYTSRKHSSIKQNQLENSKSQVQMQVQGERSSIELQSKQKNIMKSKEQMLIDKLTKQQIERRKIEQVKHSIYDTLLKKQIHKQLIDLQLSKSRQQGQQIQKQRQRERQKQRQRQKERQREKQIQRERQRQRQRQRQRERERRIVQKQKQNSIKALQNQKEQRDSLDQESIIRKKPVGNIQLKNTPYREKNLPVQSHSRSRSKSRPRSPIFTEKSRTKSKIQAAQGYSPELNRQLSPFTSKMRRRIDSKQKVFQNPYLIPVARASPRQQQHSKNVLNSSIRAKRHHKIFNQKQFPLQPSIKVQKQKQKETHIRPTQVNLKEYESPFDHINLNISNSKVNKMQQSSVEAMPISMKNKGKNYEQEHKRRLNYEIQTSDQVGPRSKFKQAGKILIKEQQQERIEKPTEKQVRIINPYQERQKIEAFLEQSRRRKEKQYSSKASINRFKSSLTADRNQKNDAKVHNEKLRFPVYDNSAYLKQKSIPGMPDYSSPQKMNRSPYKYFQNDSSNNDKYKILKKTFDSGSKFESNGKSEKRSNKPYYQPIQSAEINKIKMQESRSKSKSKSKSRYYNNQFKTRMEQSPATRYTVQRIQQRKDHSSRNYDVNSKKKVINQTQSKGAYNYYFQ